MSKTTLIECGFACLGITSCFSYNLAAFSDLRGKLLCELLPSGKFNNSDKFTDSSLYHHFSIEVSTNSLLLSGLLFQGHQNFSQNSPQSVIVFYARQFVRDVLLLRIRLGKYSVMLNLEPWRDQTGLVYLPPKHTKKYHWILNVPKLGYTSRILCLWLCMAGYKSSRYGLSLTNFELGSCTTRDSEIL